MSEIKYELVDSNYQAPELPPPAEAPPAEAPAAPDSQPTTIEIPAPVTPAAEAPAVNTPAPPETPAIPAETRVISREEALRALDLDESFTKIVDAYKSNDLGNYLKISTVDYDKVSDIELLKQEHDKKYPGLSQEDKDQLFEHKLANEYQVTGDEEADKIPLLKIKADASGIRSGLKEAQANYKLPEFKQPEPQANLQYEDTYKKIVDMVENHPDLKSLEASKILTAGTGDDIYNLEIPQDFNIRENVLSKDIRANFYSFDEKGEPKIDINKIVKAQLILSDLPGYEQKLINHGRSLQEKKAFNELNNPAASNPTGQAPATPKYELVKN